MRIPNQIKMEKTLIVYFSVPETNDPNKKITTEEENSTIVVDGKNLVNTEYAVMLIAENTEVDLYRIEPKPPIQPTINI